MDLAVLMDIGSTFTKFRAVDSNTGTLLGSTHAFTTVEEDVSQGVKEGLKELKRQGIPYESARVRLACSSAAGGLSLVAIGLVPDLTAEAARRAALGAGARIVKTYAYDLSQDEIEDMQNLKADLILLAGGTDGGNSKVLLHNCRLLGKSSPCCPIILAGNAKVQKQGTELLEAGGWSVYGTENVMPALETLNTDPVRKLIRKLFLEHITKARGLENLPAIDNVLMPTPAAVLEGVQLLHHGPEGQRGWGDIVVVDIGGATTDVYSAASGEPTGGTVYPKGLPEPHLKRTVEGDLGMRYNALSLYRSYGEAPFLDLVHKQCRNSMGQEELTEHIRAMERNPDYIPQEEPYRSIDKLLGRAAVALAMYRHCGYLEKIYTPQGANLFQYGKDLTQVGCVIGTGGILTHVQDSLAILQGAEEGIGDSMSLKPSQPEYYIDEHYTLFAAGLLSQQHPRAAYSLLEKSMHKTERSTS